MQGMRTQPRCLTTTAQPVCARKVHDLENNVTVRFSTNPNHAPTWVFPERLDHFVGDQSRRCVSSLSLEISPIPFGAAEYRVKLAIASRFVSNPKWKSRFAVIDMNVQYLLFESFMYIYVAIPPED
jgi:hypothetical protein